MRDLNVMALDMEYSQPENNIIQVGVAVGNLQTGSILCQKSWHVYQPDTLSEFIINLTGITQDDVDNGHGLEDVYKEVAELHNLHNCFRNAVTWGGGDSQDLRNALDLDDNYLFGRRWIDAKTLFVSYCFARDLKHQSGLGKSMTRLGLTFDGRKHDAMHDAVNTFKIYRELLKKIRE